MVREISDTLHAYYTLYIGNSFINSWCSYTVMHKFCDEILVYRLGKIGRYSRDRVEAVVIVTNLHIVSGKHTLCAARKRRKDRGAPCRRPLLSRASILDDVLRANAPFYLVRNGPVIVIRTRPGLAVTRASVNHAAAVHCMDSRCSGNVIIRLLIECFGETLVELFLQWAGCVSRILQVHPRKQPRLKSAVRWSAVLGNWPK